MNPKSLKIKTDIHGAFKVIYVENLGLVNPHDSMSALGLDLAAFIGQEESLQCFSCFCDTHLLRSVIKLFKLGRLDKV